MHGHGTQRFSVIRDATIIIISDCVQQQLSLTTGPSKITGKLFSVRNFVLIQITYVVQLAFTQTYDKSLTYFSGLVEFCYNVQKRQLWHHKFRVEIQKQKHKESTKIELNIHISFLLTWSQHQLQTYDLTILLQQACRKSSKIGLSQTTAINVTQEAPNY